MLQTVLKKAIRVLDDPAYNLVLHTSPIQENTNDYYHWHLGNHSQADENCRL